MKKVLSIVWKIVKGYVVLNTLTWAGIGIGRFLSDCRYNGSIVLHDASPMEELIDEIEEAAEGYKDYFSTLAEVLKRS